MTTPTPPRPSKTGEFQFVENVTGLVSKLIVGLAGMGTCGYLFFHGLKTENHPLMIYSAVGAVLSAMVLPSVFDAVKPVFEFFFPNGIPFFGGRSKPLPPGEQK